MPARQREQLREIYRLDRPLAVQYASWLSRRRARRMGLFVQPPAPRFHDLERDPAADAPVVVRSPGRRARARPRPRGLRRGARPPFPGPPDPDRLAPPLERARLLVRAAALPPLRHPLAALPRRRDDRSRTGHEHLRRSPRPSRAAGARARRSSRRRHHARFVRATLLDQLSEPYITAARARGLPFRSLLWNHALRAGLGPILQVAGLSLAALLSGTLVVEVVFAWPGLGRATYKRSSHAELSAAPRGHGPVGSHRPRGKPRRRGVHALVDPRVRDV
ncbi:MAG: ABC transporter permease [Thermoanaerobaculia bacterium]